MEKSDSSKGRILKRADPSTIQDKFLVGYQGWFTCGGDGEPVGPGHHGWLHWFNAPIPDGGKPTIDLWPDVSSYSPSELFAAPGLKNKLGDQLFLFSSRHPKTVQRHFNWMAQHGVDGAFLQRFAGQCDLEAGNHGIMKIRDEIGDRVIEAAEKEGRVFAIMYDVSGVAPDRLQRILERDWNHLIRNKGVLDSPNYLKEKGKPVVALWGFGFDNAGHTPELVKAITTFFRNSTPGGAYIMGGAPAHWRTAESDADRNPAFLNVWLNEFDAISPWTVGRYKNEQEADDFTETKMKGDVDLLKRRNEDGRSRKVDYIPVVLPGGSGYNLSDGKWGFNDIKRNGGRFLWKQIFNAKRQGVRIMYGAMWDEYDEGTAFMPAIEHKRMLPVSERFPFLALDEDGYDLPSDWYMRICGFAAEGLRGERRIHESFPSKELQDYWSSRPKYEVVNQKSGDFVSGSSKDAMGESSSGDGQSYQDWLATQKDSKDEPPPPPYSLEAEEAEAAAAQTTGAASSSVPITGASNATAVSSTTLPTTNATLAVSSGCSAQPNVTGGVSGLVANATQSYLSSAPQQSNTGPQQDQMTSLTDSFSRQEISQSSGPARMQAPPLHPSHPSAAGKQPQYGSGQTPTHGTSYANVRPTSAPQSEAVHTGQPLAPAQEALSTTSGPWSQGQWPPPEWGISNTGTPSANHQYPQQPHQGYQPQPHASGANLTRPQTFSANVSQPGGANLRPHASVNVSSVRPPQHRPSLPFPEVNVAGPTSPYPQTSAYSPTGSPGFPTSNSSFPSGPNPNLNSSFGMPSFPSGPEAAPYQPLGYPSPNASGYHNTSPYPGTASPPPHGMPQQPPHQAPPGSNSGAYGPFGGSAFPGPNTPASYSTPPSSYPYPNAPHISPSHSPPPNVGPYGGSVSNPFPGSQHSGGMQFPHSQSSEKPYNASPYAPSGYPQPGPSSYNPQYPQTNAQSSGGAWHPGGPPNPSFPPNMPPRPPTQSYGSGPSFPSSSSTSTSGPLGFAWNAVDKVAGKKTRVQLEAQAANLAQSGSKLFNKFSK